MPQMRECKAINLVFWFEILFFKADAAVSFLIFVFSFLFYLLVFAYCRFVSVFEFVGRM